MSPKLADKAKGKWQGVLPALGISRDFLTGKHGPCPMCEGRDRFRFDDKNGRGTWFCNQCGAGDGIELVKRTLSLDFRAAAQEIEKHLGTATVIAVRQGPSVDDVKREMNDIWRTGRPLAALPATNAYWNRRVGGVPNCSDLRGVPALRCPGAGEYPGMVALVRDAEGTPINMHRTFLTNGGEKAPVAEPRRVMPMPMPKGCAVRLAPYSGVLGIAEGLETAYACQTMFGVPTWAALNAENMSGWVPPEPDLRIVIFGDNDRSLTGQWASYALGRRLRNLKFEVEIRLPEREGEDWNDVLHDRLARETVPYRDAS